MEEYKKRAVFIVLLAVAMVGGSYYSFWQKSAGSSHEQLEVTGEVIVYINGAVNKPGVFSVPATARIMDVINVAGGLTPQADVSKINLAQPVKDGMQVFVAFRLNNSSVKTDNPGGKLNINLAGQVELDTLPGIGPSLAGRIVKYRQAHGNFADIEEIKKVQGINNSKFEKIKEKICI